MREVSRWTCRWLCPSAAVSPRASTGPGDHLTSDAVGPPSLSEIYQPQGDIWRDLLVGRLEVSPHLPLHRMASALILGKGKGGVGRGLVNV